jgi:soluble lytic murein transglycosylase
VKRKSWNSAFKTANKSSDRLLLKIVTWMYLKETNNSSTFRDYKKFIDRNQNWPRISRLRYLAEHKINYKDLSAIEVIDFFKDEKPSSGYGYIRLG